MSWAPCSNCRNTTAGRLKFVYVAMFEGQVRLSYRMRLCQGCYDSFIPDLIATAEVQDKLGRWATREEQL